MKVHFKGTRGSIPIAPTATDIQEKVVASLLAARGKDLRSERQIREFVEKSLPFRHSSTFGGNTPCVHLETGSEDYLIFDGGSGLRVLGKELMDSGSASGKTFHIFLSHFHYDHIQGIPFFAPAYVPGNKIVFHAAHKNLRETLIDQMKEPYFPIDFDTFQCETTFEVHAPGDVIETCNCEIRLIEQDHPGVSFGYRVDGEDASVVYSHKNQAHCKDYPFIDFIRNANLLIIDAPYTHSQSMGIREHWGHSSNIMGVELAARGEVETLAIFHHDPGSSDEEIEDFLAHTKKFLERSKIAVKETKSGIPGAPSPRSNPQKVLMAYDGLTLSF